MSPTIERICPPKGPGLFLRGLRGRDPIEYGTKLVVSGFTWVIIGGPWHDTKGRRWINSPETIAHWTTELTRLGIEVYVWGYPDCDQTESFCTDIIRCLTPLTRGVVLDPEKEEKVVGSRDRDSLLAIFEALWHYADVEGWDGFSVGLSSWGDPRPHREFPWEVVQCADFVIPQLYLETLREHVKLLEGIWLERAMMTGENSVLGVGAYKTVIKDGKRSDPPKTKTEFLAHLEALGSPFTFAIWSDLSMTEGLFQAAGGLGDWGTRGH